MMFVVVGVALAVVPLGVGVGVWYRRYKRLRSERALVESFRRAMKYHL